MSCCFNDTIMINNGKKCSSVVPNNTWKQALVSEKITLPDNMPNIRGIKSASAILKIYNAYISATPTSSGTTNAEGTLLTGYKAFISGEIIQNFVYEDYSCSLYVYNYIEPFSSYIILDNATNPNLSLCVNGCIEDSNFNCINTREILGNIGVFLSASLS